VINVMARAEGMFRARHHLASPRRAVCGYSRWSSEVDLLVEKRDFGSRLGEGQRGIWKAEVVDSDVNAAFTKCSLVSLV